MRLEERINKNVSFNWEGPFTQYCRERFGQNALTLFFETCGVYMVKINDYDVAVLDQAEFDYHYTAEYSVFDPSKL